MPNKHFMTSLVFTCAFRVNTRAIPLDLEMLVSEKVFNDHTRNTICSRPVPGSLFAVHLTYPRARIVISTLNTTVSTRDFEQKCNPTTHTAKVPALTGIALASVGPMPFQNPRAPSACQVFAKQSRIVLYFWSFPNPSLCILLLITSNG